MPSKDSKTNFALLRNKILSQNGKNYWRSVEEFVDAPEFAEFVSREYPQHAEEWSDGFSRRNFIKIMGASLALAGLSGCIIQPAEKIVPYVKQPEEIIPGKPLFFATAATLGGVATGLLARSNEGRPTKIEGNPDHVGSLGATNVFAQAELLSLYDPDRTQQVFYRNEQKTWQSFVAEFRGKVEENRQNGGAGIRFLTETVTSPTLIAQFKQILTELPGAKWYQYEPVNKDNAHQGAKLAFGSPVNTVYKFDKAERILSLDADIFGGTNVRYMKDFSKGRKVGHGEESKMNRLYTVETTLSLTGAKSDHRLAVKPSEMTEVAKAIAKALGVSGASSAYSNKWVDVMAKDLLEAKGKSLVVAGDNQPPVVHALAHAMNAALNNVGQTVTYTDPLSEKADVAQTDGLKELIKDIDAGAVKMLVILGGNPVYNTPADAKLSKERMMDDAKLPFRLHLSQSMDETSELCHWHVNAKHFLEMWSDTRAYDGTATIVQPLVQPLYDGKSAHEIVQLFAKENFEKKEIDIVKDYWKTNGLADDKAWRKAVHDGSIPNSALPAKTVTANTGFLSQSTPAPTGSGDLEIAILPDPSIYDGRYTNNGWLQELPNPLNKVTWENVALVSPKTAEKLGVNQGRDANQQAGAGEGTTFYNTKGGNLFSDLVTLTYQDGKVSQKVPIWVSPGQPDDVVTIFLGYGRTRAGKVGTGLGYNAYEVRKSDAMWFGKGSISKTGETTTIASSQTHFNMEGRENEILRVFDYDSWEKDAQTTHQHNEYELSMFEPHEYKERKWGMNIDLNSCVGCNACVLACQSENNIPVVGKEQVERSREMHWMRVDAYFEGEDVNNPKALNFQPMLCQQCEQAPCELVCPVHATVHSAEGLNDMVYNRCIGTRYCSNNCPYKVRRFNFLLFQDWNTPQYKLMRNPEVSIRSRGVMEKCTYCTQRISAARIEAEKAGREVRDGEIVTACEAVCPTDAIVFGNLNDPNSRVAKLSKDHRNYNVLNSLNTQPRTTYLAGLRNQNKEMPDYKAQEWVKKAAEKAKEGAANEGETKKSEGASH
ncbi:MAG: TAT-variant-translocated molybdopterin oxidoreductase [Pyrinomonadaceae bacterium]|nr:TAT-variant-translocated molybdopterin oxidoreductase [Pyrinomonadaceae bacterium]